MPWRRVPLLIMTMAFCADSNAAAQITVGANVHVSTALPAINNGEPVICADPQDEKRLVAAAMLDAGWRRDEKYHDGVAYLSEDGGVSWRPTLDLRHRLDRVADPSCSFGEHGSVFIGFMTQAASEGPGFRLSLFRSLDGGRTWEQSTTAPHSHGVDRPYVAVGRGVYRGRIYANAHLTAERTDSGARAPRAVTLYRSTDNGATIEPPTLLPMADLRSHTTPGEIAVLSDGIVVALYAESRGCLNESGGATPCPDSRPTTIRAYRSTDGGATISEPVKVGTTQFETLPILLAVDRSSGPFHDRLYAAWVDFMPGYRATRLMLCYSSDKGRSWSPARLVSDNMPLEPPVAGADVSRPAISVNAAGVVGVSWYDERESAGREHLSDEMGYHLRFTASLDGGDTFLPSVRVAAFPARDQRAESLIATVFPPLRELESVDTWVSLRPFWVGHTSGLASDAAGVFHPVWVDARTGVGQLWAAAVRVTGVALLNGSRELSTLDDLSQEVAIDVSGIRYDRSTGSISAEIRLRNSSPRAVVPRCVRLIALAAGIGNAAVVGADNGIRGPGAVWGFADLVPNGVLMPGETSNPRSIRFSIADRHQATGARVGSGFKGDLVHFDARVLGERR